MKVHKKESGVYTFTNGEGFSGEILLQPEGLWSVFDPTTYENLEVFPTKREAVAYAEDVPNPEKVEAQSNMTEIELILSDPWAWLEK